MNIKKKLALLFSGGIDSSFSTFILKKNNFYIETIFIKNWEEFENKNCFFKIDLIYVKNFCKIFKIKLHVLDYSKFYWNVVFLEFLRLLKLGLTPNPDIYCNREIKFKILFYYTIHFLKFDLLLTGHYAGILKYKKNVKFIISADFKKNQTYFLFSIKKIVKKYIIFPLLNYFKVSIKSFIYYFNFLNFNKKSSVGICFIGEKKFKIFINRYIKKNVGIVINDKKKIITNHVGIFSYTLGERFKHYKSIEKHYIFKKNIKKNLLYITSNKKFLLMQHILIKKINFKIKEEKNIYFVKIRHSNEVILSFFYWNKVHKKYAIFFKIKQKIINPGQNIAFYKNNECIGGGEILKILK
ncbi:MAG TPA: tRNA 2-thiouridine(34) synthase MnmA [Candidatus Azoamicus sp.]